MENANLVRQSGAENFGRIVYFNSTSPALLCIGNPYGWQEFDEGGE
jgi:hypothetical protein